MKQLTLTAIYGQKRNQELKDLIQSIWKQIDKSRLRNVFRKYQLNQIHSTLIGMEKVIGYDDHLNANIWEQEGNKKAMNFSELYSTVNDFFPMTIQLGGFKPDFDGFKSLNDSPYKRSFQINWNTKKVILMGWAMQEKSNLANRNLVNLRQALYEKHNILHKYKKDNDFYMVLGQIENLDLFDDKVLEELKTAGKKLEKDIQDHLAKYSRRIEIGMDDVSLVRYEKETLELNTSEAWNLKCVEHDSELMKELY